MDSEWVRLIVSVLSGLAATIPLVIQLVKYVRKTIQDKNWPEVVKLVTSYMERADVREGCRSEGMGHGYG